jgi:tetratricopeptide (TPR) repeat protein
MRKLFCVMVLATACGKHAEKKPEEAPKTVEQPKPTAPSGEVPITSKSPEAINEFKTGLDFMMHARPGADAHFKKAVELDPEFAQAMALAGVNTPGAEGTEMLSKAGTLATKLPEAERAFIEAYQALRAGDGKKAMERFERAAELAPGDWRPPYLIATLANNRFDSASALRYAEKAKALAPNEPILYNVLAYAHAATREWDKAIEAAKKQVELLPNDANPRDTLAEIQLWAGKFDDAEKSFLEATKLDPNYPAAWAGVALARGYRGDYKGALEAYDQEKTAKQPGVKYEAMLDSAWIQLAQDKLPDAMATLDALDKDPDAPKFPLYAYSALDRAHMLSLSGKYADATKWYATALSRSEALAGDARNGVMGGYRIGVLRNAALQGKPAPDADKLVADEEALAASQGNNSGLQNTLAHIHGLAAWSKSGPKAAEDELVKCDPHALMCRYDLVRAAKKAGDADGAKTIYQQLVETPQRIPEGVYIKTHPLK